MDDGAAERDELLRRQMKIMPPQRFEQLILELAERECPEVRRVEHPDGGADVLRPAADGRRAEVWQAKRYGQAINWTECEKSLTTAIERWQPSKVTFCFPRDLSEQLEHAFDEKLVKHPSTVAAGVEVTLWNGSELVRRLDDNPDLKPRFFGAEQDPLMTRLDRMASAGGKLESSEDLVERAKTLSKYAEEQDPDYTYGVVSTSLEAPPNDWQTLPYLKLEVTSADGRVQVAAWEREGADVELPAFSFTDNEPGRQARAEAVRALARGGEAIITDGAILRFNAPQVLRDMVPDPSLLHGGNVRIPRSDPFEAELEIQTPIETLNLPFQVRPVPPPPGAFGCVAGYIGDTLVEANFAVVDEQHAAANFSISSRFGSDARTNVEAARLIYAWATHEQLTFRADQAFSHTVTGTATEALGEELSAEMLWRTRFYADVVFLEERLAQDFPIPDQLTPEDLDAVGTAADVLRTGKGTATFGHAEGVVNHPSEIPGVPEQFRKAGSARRMVTYPIFGREVELGEADYQLPPLKVVHIVPHGQTADSPARIVLAAEDDGHMTFEMVSSETPESNPIRPDVNPG